jgi:hypothetical protein
MTLFTDGPTASEFGQASATVTAATVQSIPMLPNGGFAARFEPL